MRATWLRVFFMLIICDQLKSNDNNENQLIMTCDLFVYAQPNLRCRSVMHLSR